ncbi:MAG: PAS domain-containing protein [Cyanobacteria bacterium P01_D01_bin.115]
MPSLESRYCHILPICEGIAAWLYPHAEVVLHDLESDTVVRIWNNISRRKSGDASLIDREVQLKNAVDVYGPYEKINWDGRRLKCVSNVVKDSQGHRLGLLCLNLDVSSFDTLKGFLESFTTVTSSLPTALAKNDWREHINETLNIFLKEQETTLEALTKSQKIAAIAYLDKRKLFATRNAASHLAGILGVSRATIYNWLNKSRQKS